MLADPVVLVAVLVAVLADLGAAGVMGHLRETEHRAVVAVDLKEGAPAVRKVDVCLMGRLPKGHLEDPTQSGCSAMRWNSTSTRTANSARRN